MKGAIEDALLRWNVGAGVGTWGRSSRERDLRGVRA